MQQILSCPVCGSQIIEGQQFCGNCGTKLIGITQQAAPVCTTCGVEVAGGQQFCGNCGTTLSMGAQQQTSEMQPVRVAPVAVGSTPVATAAPAAPESAPTDQPEAEKEEVKDMATVRSKYGLLRFVAIVFQVLGWIILVGGIAGTLYVALSGTDVGVAWRYARIIILVGGILISIIAGLTYLAYAELFKAVIDVEKNTRARESN